VAKAILNLSSYSGGLNDKTNPRDILDNEFESLDTFAIDIPGKLSVMGAGYEHNLTPLTSSVDIQQGTDLWHMNTDRRVLDGSLSNRELLLINDRANSSVSVYDIAATNQDTTIDYGTTAQELEVNIVDGAIRIVPTNPQQDYVDTGIDTVGTHNTTVTSITVNGFVLISFSTGDIISITVDGTTEKLYIDGMDIFLNTLTVIRGYQSTTAVAPPAGASILKDGASERAKWFGYLNATKNLGNQAAGALIKSSVGWKSVNSYLESSLGAFTYIPKDTSLLTGPTINGLALPLTHDSTFHVVSHTNGTLSYHEDITVTSSVGGYQNSDIVKYFGVGSKIVILDNTATPVARKFTIDVIDAANGKLTVNPRPSGYTLPQNNTISHINYENTGTLNGFIRRLPIANIIDSSSNYGSLSFYLYPGDTTTNSGTGKWFDTTDTKTYFYQQLTYLDDQESDMEYIGEMTSAIADRKLFLQAWGRISDNDRLKGVKVFYREATVETGSIEALKAIDTIPKYLLFEIDYRKGIRFSNSDEWGKFGFHDAIANNKIYHYPAQEFSTITPIVNLSEGINFLESGRTYFKTPPVTEVAIERDKNIIGQGKTYYKTSTLLNRRLYVGNVGYVDSITSAIKHSNDTVFKSAVNKFDYFTYNNRIDVEVNDGEDIIKLESLNGRLYEFKKNTLYIINVTRDIEYLESTLEFRGIEKKHHSIKGEGFIAWFNKNGVYMTNGKNTKELLLDKKGEPRLKYWKDNYYHDDAVIGFLPEEKMLIITHASGQNNSTSTDKQKVLLYDLKSGAWSYGSKRLPALNTTNLIVTNEGQISWISKDSTNYKFRYFNSTPNKLLNTSNIDEMALKTKEFTFGKPSVDKKIISVYLSYKNGNGITVYGFRQDGQEEILATLEGDAETSFKTLRINMREAKTEFVDKKSFNSVKSFGLRMSGSDVATDFEINDIQVIFREKSVK